MASAHMAKGKIVTRATSDKATSIRIDLHQRDQIPDPQPQPPATTFQRVHVSISVIVLVLNYFAAQYDKFILSYFQTSFSESLNLSPPEYGVLSGYATGIVYALLALPIAYLADYFPSARV